MKSFAPAFINYAQANPLPAQLEGQIAQRDRAWDYSGLSGFLPNPDPVLLKLDGQGEEVLHGLTADPHLISVIQTRKLGSLKTEFRFESGKGSDHNVSGASKKLQENLSEDLRGIDLYQVLSEILDAPFFGMRPLELIWAAKGDRIALKDIRPKPATWFRFDRDNKPLFVEWDGYQGRELPWGKFVLARHFPSYDNPYGLRLLSRCLWPVTFKKGGIRFWVTLAEKYGLPLMVGKYPVGTSAEGQDEMLAALAKAVRDAVMVLPEGSQVEIQETAKGSADVHQSLVDLMNREISKAILGQNLTTEAGQVGSHAASKTHMDVLSTYQDADRQLVKRVMNEIAEIYTQLNHPTANAPRFHWFEEDDPKVEWAQRDQQLAQMGVQFTPEYLCRQYGLQPGDFSINFPKK